MTTNLTKITDDSLAKAVELLHRGSLISVPTETVYGIAADATNPQAILALFAAKKRDEHNPVQIISSSFGQAQKLGIFSSTATLLAKKFWPGGLTLVVQRRDDNSLDSSAFCGLNTVGIRVSAHPFIMNLCKSFGKPIAMSSANLSGEPACTNAIDVQKCLKDTLPLIIDDGESNIGTASTVIDCTCEPPRILREGSISAFEIEMLLQNNN
jgi:L-threonylcarbamoyladenylate synthase